MGAVAPQAAATGSATPSATPAAAASVPTGSADSSRPKSRLHSVGKLRALPKTVDIARPGMARHVARRRSYKGEIIMFTSDNQMGGWAYHWVNQMRIQGYEHWLILADEKSTCGVLQDGWAPMVTKFGEEPLSCVYSSYPKEHPGWEQWKPRGGEDSLHHVYILWSSRWWVAWKLLSEGVSVLSLDVDAVLLTDIYPLLRGPPMSKHDVIISRNSDESQSLNCGFVYFNLKAARHASKVQEEHGLAGAGDRVILAHGYKSGKSSLTSFRMVVLA